MTQLLQTGDGSAAADQARAQGRPSPHPSVHLLHKRIQLLQLLHHTGEERNAPQAHYPPQDATSPVTIFCHLGWGGEAITRQRHKPLLLLLSSTLGSRQEKAHPTLLTGARRATRHARCAHAASPPRHIQIQNRVGPKAMAQRRNSLRVGILSPP